MIDSIDERRLEALRQAAALARSRAWALGARGQGHQKKCTAQTLTVIDIDATLTSAR